MTTVIPSDVEQRTYALERTPREYQRLRAQAAMWSPAAERILDRIGLAPGASCLDAGCGPGETMRLMADRVGADGSVVGTDVDATLGALTESVLRTEGYRQCRFHVADLTTDEPIPGAPFDLVYSRLVLFHLPERVAVIRRLWESVAPGGHLVFQDYDLAHADVEPALSSVDDVVGVLIDAFGAQGCDVRAGIHLPNLFTRAGIGAPDGTDVAGRTFPFGTGVELLAETFRSVLPLALARGVVTEERAGEMLVHLRADGAAHADSRLLWPLMHTAWKRKN
jgi:SAM-dependent methyltransferase